MSGREKKKKYPTWSYSFLTLGLWISFLRSMSSLDNYWARSLLIFDSILRWNNQGACGSGHLKLKGKNKEHLVSFYFLIQNLNWVLGKNDITCNEFWFSHPKTILIPLLSPRAGYTFDPQVPYDEKLIQQAAGGFHQSWLHKASSWNEKARVCRHFHLATFCLFLRTWKHLACLRSWRGSWTNPGWVFVLLLLVRKHGKFHSSEAWFIHDSTFGFNSKRNFQITHKIQIKIKIFSLSFLSLFYSFNYIWLPKALWLS